jgi:hypothetical protein
MGSTGGKDGIAKNLTESLLPGAVRCPRKRAAVELFHSAILKISVNPQLSIAHYTSSGDNQPGIGRLPPMIDVERSCVRQVYQEST